MKDKDYFVVTTNVDHQFQKAGFDKKRLFYTQGDYGLFQSVNLSIQKTYDNEEWVMKAMEAQGFVKDSNGVFQVPENGKLSMSIPTELIPKCPDDGLMGFEFDFVEIWSRWANHLMGKHAPLFEFDGDLDEVFRIGRFVVVIGAIYPLVEDGAAQNQYLYPQLAELIHNGSGDGVIYKYANGVIACGQGSGILVETGFKKFDFQAGIRGIVIKAGNIVGFGVKKSYFHGILPPEWI